MNSEENSAPPLRHRIYSVGPRILHYAFAATGNSVRTR